MIADQQRQGRVPPHDLDAETSVLGAVLLEPAAMARVVDRLRPDEFYRENNGLVFDAMVALFRDGTAIDLTTLGAVLSDRGLLERIGGRAHLAVLQESVPTAASVEDYAVIVRSKAEKRALIDAGYASVALGYDDRVSAEDALTQAQGRHFALTDRRSAVGFVALVDLLGPAWDRVGQQAQDADAKPAGLRTGFPDLDRLLSGIKPGNLVIVGGPTSSGKTSLAMQIATQAAIEQRVPVAVFSLEMSGDELVERMLCEQARVDSQRLKRGLVSEAEFERLGASLGPLGEAPVWIDDRPGLDDLTFRLRARQVAAQHGVGLIVVDYLQLMQSKARRGDAVQEVTAISQALKAVARELSIPVLALSQLSRAPAARPDKRPMLSDLRQSGSIEQDADLVLLLYRDDYYNRDKSEKPGIAEIIVAKHRNGPTGTVELLFRKECTRFESADRHHVPMGDGE